MTKEIGGLVRSNAISAPTDPRADLDRVLAQQNLRPSGDQPRLARWPRARRAAGSELRRADRGARSIAARRPAARRRSDPHRAGRTRHGPRRTDARALTQRHDGLGTARGCPCRDGRARGHRRRRMARPGVAPRRADRRRHRSNGTTGRRDRHGVARSRHPRGGGHPNPGGVGGGCLAVAARHDTRADSPGLERQDTSRDDRGQRERNRAARRRRHDSRRRSRRTAGQRPFRIGRG